MKNNSLLSYKGYFGSVEISLQDNVMHGMIECIADVVTYESDNISGLKNAFEAAVDDYLATCAKLGREPNKTLSGTFNVRIGSELHKHAYLASKKFNISLNDFIKKAVEEKLYGTKSVTSKFDSQINEQNCTLSKINGSGRTKASCPSSDN